MYLVFLMSLQKKKVQNCKLDKNLENRIPQAKDWIQHLNRFSSWIIPNGSWMAHVKMPGLKLQEMKENSSQFHTGTILLAGLDMRDTEESLWVDTYYKSVAFWNRQRNKELF